jgi:hypothetical protein
MNGRSEPNFVLNMLVGVTWGLAICCPPCRTAFRLYNSELSCTGHLKDGALDGNVVPYLVSRGAGLLHLFARVSCPSRTPLTHPPGRIGQCRGMLKNRLCCECSVRQANMHRV